MSQSVSGIGIRISPPCTTARAIVQRRCASSRTIRLMNLQPPPHVNSVFRTTDTGIALTICDLGPRPTVGRAEFVARTLAFAWHFGLPGGPERSECRQVQRSIYAALPERMTFDAHTTPSAHHGPKLTSIARFRRPARASLVSATSTPRRVARRQQSPYMALQR
jgi:hypothetical protein